MTDAAAPMAPGAPFAPCALVPISISRTTVNLYQCVDSSMQPHERAHAYHMNLTALKSQNIEPRLQLNALGPQLNLLVTVDGIISNWSCFFHNPWYNFGHLQILSFHSANGNGNENTTTAVDLNILLPVQNGNIADCCWPSIKFVQVQLTIDFVLLVNIQNQVGLTILWTDDYIKLLQTTRTMVHGNNVAYNLMTFYGAADLCTLSPAKVKAQILDAMLQDGPVELQPTSFSLMHACTTGEALRAEINSKILRLAFATVCNTLFLELCPGYSDHPHAALDHICQVHVNREGNQVASLVQSYFQQLMSAAQPFTNQRDFPISLCAKFMEGLDQRLIMGFRWNFPQHSIIQPLDAMHQQKILQEMLQAAQQAEEDYGSVQQAAREVVGLSQAFVSGGASVGATTFPSQAEKTLARYSPGDGHSTDGSSRAPHGGKRNGKVGLGHVLAVAAPTHGLNFVLQQE
jgi:hypothetical protein